MRAQRGVRDTNVKARKLEFGLHIYFAVAPLLLPERSGRETERALAASMAGFRTFLETRGAELSQTPEFLPY